MRPNMHDLTLGASGQNLAIATHDFDEFAFTADGPPRHYYLKGTDGD